MSGIESKVDKLSIVTGQIAARSLKAEDKIYYLNDIGFSIYSQFDEDGIIEWLIQRLPISSSRFIEFGVENYSESNTRFLLMNRNWKGLIMDSSEDYIGYIRNDRIYWRHDLTALCAFITPDNVNYLFEKEGFTGNIGILSIDAGGMDYWIWKEIKVINPDIVICEYNTVFGDVHPIAVPYQKDFVSKHVHHSGLYWGASTKALELLAQQKGYVLIGSNRGGNNLFFVKNSLYSYVKASITNSNSRPSLYRDSRSPEGQLTYIGGIKRFDAIKHLSVLDVDSQELVKLESIAPVYSSDWLDLMN